MIKTEYGILYTHDISEGWYYMINGWGGAGFGAFLSKEDAIKDHNMRIKGTTWKSYMDKYGKPTQSIIAYGKPPNFKVGRRFTFNEAYPHIAKLTKQKEV